MMIKTHSAGVLCEHWRSLSAKCLDVPTVYGCRQGATQVLPASVGNGHAGSLSVWQCGPLHVTWVGQAGPLDVHGAGQVFPVLVGGGGQGAGHVAPLTV